MENKRIMFLIALVVLVCALFVCADDDDGRDPSFYDTAPTSIVTFMGKKWFCLHGGIPKPPMTVFSKWACVCRGYWSGIKCESRISGSPPVKV